MSGPSFTSKYELLASDFLSGRIDIAEARVELRALGFDRMEAEQHIGVLVDRRADKHVSSLIAEWQEQSA